MTAVADPYTGAVARGLLARIGPLAKLAAPLPAMVALIFSRDLLTPLVFLAVAYVMIFVGARVSARVAALLVIGLPIGAAVVGLSLGLWVDRTLVDGTDPVLSVGSWTLYAGAVEIGLATGTRLAAIFSLGLVAGLTTTGPDLVRATVQQLRVPYRIGYAALAAIRFVPRFGYELEVIRQAHRVRGALGGRGPIAAIARWWGYIVPLLAGAIRHAERVALAMDARAFGAHPDRTERHLLPWRTRDTVFVLVFWVASAAILAALFPWGM
ncbi:energy-coupling factor transporter transmembrane component T family protein [Microbacterium sp. NPDC077663]|uniref:energy-coupling factor transporter transmembrane component T family protein n=1 Tax=Microbacterium sp. NPDC077663 TaxID=3364189 RepID=UPI0037CA6308